MSPQYSKLFSQEVAGELVTYYLTESLVRVDGASAVRYGAALLKSGGEYAEISDIFGDRESAVEFIETLFRGLVTPMTLRDVVMDVICT